MKLVFPSFLLAAICAICRPAWADEKKTKDKEPVIHETVMVTASAVRESEKDVLGSYTLVRRDTIERWKPVNLNEAFDLAGPELSLSAGSTGQMSSTFIRGASSKHTLFMINNVRINDPAALSLDVSMISPQVFEQVEIIDGPQSSLYGSEAMGGVVNLVPQKKPGLKFSLWGGSKASLSTAFSWGRDFNPHVNLTASYSGFRTDGLGKNSDFNTHNLISTLNLRWGGLEMKPFFYFVGSGAGIPFNMGQPSPLRRTHTRLWLAGLPIQWQFSRRMMLETTWAYFTRDYALEDPQDSWGSKYHTFSRNSQVQGRLIATWISAESPTIFGIEMTGSRIDEESDSGKTFDRLSLSGHSFWVEQVVKHRGWRSVFSLRSDRAGSFPTHLSPRVSIGYDHTFGSVLAGLYAMASGGFRSPKPAEYASPWGNPHLLPEKSFALEGGVTLASKSFSLRVGYFATRYRDMIAFDYASNQLQNSERDRISGWQLQPGFQLGNISLSASFLKLRAIDEKTNERLIRRPDYVLKIQFQGEWRKFYTIIMARFVGDRKDIDERTWQIVDAESFGIFSLATGYRIGSRVSLFLKVQNVFDRSYMEIVGYPAPGRMGYLGLDFHL